MAIQTRCFIRLNSRRNVYLFLTIVFVSCAALLKLPQFKVPSYVTKWSICPVHTRDKYLTDDLNQSYALLARSKTLLQQLDTVLVASNLKPGELRSNLEQSHILQTEIEVFITQYAVQQSIIALDVQPTSEAERDGLRLQCNNVLDQMLKGHWQQRAMTAQEEEDIKQFHIAVGQEQNIAPNLQSPDLKCGNLSQGLYRALCDPYGPTPCCYRGTCTLKSQEECACPDCFDMRTRIHAEFARWIPGDPSCQVHNFSVDQMCQLLDNSCLYFVGDSYIRHIYTAFIMFARNDELGGALQNNTPPEIRKKCLGMYMFTEKTCRLHLDTAVTICNGRVTAKMFYLVESASATHIHRVVNELENRTRSFVLLGTGVHDRFNTQAIQTRILLPILQTRKKRSMTWPKLVWATTHAPGLLKNIWSYPEQSFEGVSSYNSKMIQFLSPWNVSIFDTYNMTLGLRSFDGSHYGLGVNRMKMTILLNYILELFVEKLW